MSLIKQCQNERGVALVISLMFLVILGLLGTTAVVLTTTDLQIGGNYKANAKAFYDADAGANYAIAMMTAGLKDGTFPPGTTLKDMAIGDTAALDAFLPAPSGFDFSYEPPGSPVLTKIAENRFSFTTTGAISNNSSVTIIGTCKQRPAINYAAFGDEKLDIKSSAVITSYDSSSPDPTVSNPLTALTHEADIASNEWLITGSSSTIDGSGVLGEQPDGSPTVDAISDPSDFYGPTPLNVGQIDPDPLDINSGGEYDPTTYASINDNALATGLVGDVITLGTEATLYDKSGDTANYYLTSITVGNGKKLTIDTSGGGKVRVFLTGPIDLKLGSQIVMIPSSVDDATKFTIFSNSTDKISIKNSGSFVGLIYAPYSTNVDVMNSGDFYGAVWGADVELKNTGQIYYDSALSGEFLTKNVVLTTWQDMRN